MYNESDVMFEVRRIYENGGELRKLQGENKSRIFVKGKYFPGLINTRSIGDQIGRGIGVIAEPHLCKCKDVIGKDMNCYLFMCTDGVSNVCGIEKIIQLIQANDTCKLYMYMYI